MDNNEVQVRIFAQRCPKRSGIIWWRFGNFAGGRSDKKGDFLLWVRTISVLMLCHYRNNDVRKDCRFRVGQVYLYSGIVGELAVIPKIIRNREVQFVCTFSSQGFPVYVTTRQLYYLFLMNRVLTWLIISWLFVSVGWRSLWPPRTLHLL